MKSFQNLSIKTKLIVTLLLLALLGLGIGVYSMVKSQRLSYLTSEIYYHPYAVSNTVRDIHIHIITMHRDMKDVTLHYDDNELNSLITKVDALEKEVFEEYKLLKELYLGNLKDINSNEELFKNWRPIREEIIRQTRAKHIQAAIDITKGEGARYVKKLTDSVGKLIHFADNKAERFFKDAQDEYHNVIATTLLFFIALLIITILSIYGARKNILNPLSALANLMKNLQTNDLIALNKESISKYFKHDDEIGSLFSSFEQMLRFLNHAYEELENEKHYISTIIESNSTAIIACDTQGVITTYNQKAKAIFGYSQNEMLGFPNIPKIIPENYLAVHSKAFARFVQSGSQSISSDVKELYAQRKNGQTFPIKLSFGLSRESDKTIIIANILDVTYEKELIRELQERSMELLTSNHSLEVRVNKEILKNKLQLEKNFNQARLAQMGEMISMIAHQWRQPLSAISSITTNLRIKMQLEDAVNKDQSGLFSLFEKKMQEVDQLVQQLSCTIDDFRNFYKPNKEKVQLSIPVVIDKALAIIEGSLKTKNIYIKKEYRTHALFTIHENELMQVILNILKNSEDNFLERHIDQPTISISVEDTNDGVRIKICDNGEGIPDAIIKDIFTPYFSTKDEKNGTGLGLHMSKVIIEDHHQGRIEAHNVSNGCCFIIDLPSQSL